MEVSSHALALGRVYGLRFHTAVFTNLTRDHLDFHGNMDSYFAAKATLFTGAGDQPAYSADYSNRDNGLIYAANPKKAVGGEESSKMDFRHADRAPTQKLNVILWKDAMGSKAVPTMLTEKRKFKKDDDD